MAGQMLDPSTLDLAVEAVSLAAAGLLLAWSLRRPRPPHRRRDDDTSS
jgi:hypothetical protein